MNERSGRGCALAVMLGCLWWAGFIATIVLLLGVGIMTGGPS